MSYAEMCFYLKQDLMFLNQMPTVCHVNGYSCDTRYVMYCPGYYIAYSSRGQLF